MAKKEKRELTPEELEAKKIKKQRRSDRWTKFWAVLLAFVLVAGVAFGAKTMGDKALAKAKEEAAQSDNANTDTNTNTNTNTTPTQPTNNTTPTQPSGDNNATPADNSGSNNATPADNSGSKDATPAATDPASVAQTINAAMAAAANAGYDWTRTGELTNLVVPSKDALNGIIGKVSEGATVDSVVGGFLGAGAPAKTESLTRAAGQTPMNEKGDDTYYHWDHYQIIPTSVTAEDLQNLQVNGNEYTFTLAACQNPAPNSAGFSRFTNDYVTLEQVNTEIANNIKGVSVSDMTATYGPMNVKMTIENGKVTALHYDYVANVNPLSLKALILNIKGQGDMKVSADYSNFKY